MENIPKYNKYATRSLICGIIGLLAIIGQIIVIVKRTEIHDWYTPREYVLWLEILTVVGIVFEILGILSGRKGLKSEKVGMARIGIAMSILILILLLIGGVIGDLVMSLG
jgi:membrane associated rhomboid family serine protease